MHNPLLIKLSRTREEQNYCQFVGGGGQIWRSPCRPAVNTARGSRFSAATCLRRTGRCDSAIGDFVNDTAAAWPSVSTSHDSSRWTPELWRALPLARSGAFLLFSQLNLGSELNDSLRRNPEVVGGADGIAHHEGEQALAPPRQGRMDAGDRRFPPKEE